MGAGSSKQLVLQNPSSYVERGNLSKELANHILTLLFSKADFQDILSLSSISECPRYVFTTADALQTLFQSIQVYPSRGKSGEILFTPISHISPGLMKDKTEGSQELLERTKVRNQMCMDVAYFYVRIFQIYGALALTILDTDPTRRKMQSRPVARSGIFSSASAKPGYRPPAFFSGGALGSSPRSIGAEIRKKMEVSPFSPLVNILSISRSATSSNDITPLTLDDKDPAIKIIIYWDPSEARKAVADRRMTLKGVFIKKEKRDRSFEIEMIADSKPTTRGDYEIETEISLRINGKNIQTFRKQYSKWEYIYDDDNYNPQSPDHFYEKIHEYFSEGENSQVRPSSQLRSSDAGRISRSDGISITSGKSVFEGFEQLKKIYDSRRTGKGFPKAYCIARAMILMSPIFDYERLDKRQPYYSQVCKTTYDFESTEIAAMPSPGKHVDANIYFRSLVSLYYDSYKIRGDSVVFEKTGTGSAQLRAASAKIAAIYNIKSNPEGFLESASSFTASRICSESSLTSSNTGSRSVSSDVLLQYNNEDLRKFIIKESIEPMLIFQEAHTKKVNELLRKMFNVTVDKQGHASMTFAKALKEGGRATVDQFCTEARGLLLDYYLKSEALYNHGVIIMEKHAKDMLRVVV